MKAEEFYKQRSNSIRELWALSPKQIEYIALIMEEYAALFQPPVSGSALPNGWMDWNKLTLDEMVEYLRNKYMFSSSGDAKCIYHLIEFYDNHK